MTAQPDPTIPLHRYRLFCIAPDVEHVEPHRYISDRGSWCYAGAVKQLEVSHKQLRAEVERLRELVRDAYAEGYDEGLYDGLAVARGVPNKSPEYYWPDSEAFAALTPEDPSDG